MCAACEGEDLPESHPLRVIVISIVVQLRVPSHHQETLLVRVVVVEGVAAVLRIHSVRIVSGAQKSALSEIAHRQWFGGRALRRGAVGRQVLCAAVRAVEVGKFENALRVARSSEKG